MGFTYSGTVQEITQPLSEVIPAYQNGQPLTGTPISTGTCEVQPVGTTGNIAGGAFSVNAEDETSTLAPYRLAITTELPDASSDGSRVVYRGPNLFRSGSGWTEGGLAIYVHVLDSSDLFALAALKISIALPVPYATLQSQAANSLPQGITITQIQGVNGLLSISIKKGSLTGSFTASVTPDTSEEFESYVVLTLVDLNLDGIEGWYAEFTSEDLIRSDIQTGLNSAAESFNVQLASQVGAAQALLPASPPSVLTLTLLDVTVGPTGLDATPVLGLIQNAVADPCQEFRGKIAVLKSDLATAGPDDLSQSMIDGMEKQMSEWESKLASCVAANQSGPHPIVWRNPGAVSGIGTVKMESAAETESPRPASGSIQTTDSRQERA